MDGNMLDQNWNAQDNRSDNQIIHEEENESGYDGEGVNRSDMPRDSLFGMDG